MKVILAHSHTDTSLKSTSTGLKKKVPRIKELSNPKMCQAFRNDGIGMMVNVVRWWNQRNRAPTKALAGKEHLSSFVPINPRQLSKRHLTIMCFKCFT